MCVFIVPVHHRAPRTGRPCAPRPLLLAPFLWELVEAALEVVPMKMVLTPLCLVLVSAVRRASTWALTTVMRLCVPLLLAAVGCCGLRCMSTQAVPSQAVVSSPAVVTTTELVSLAVGRVCFAVSSRMLCSSRSLSGFLSQPLGTMLSAPVEIREATFDHRADAHRAAELRNLVENRALSALAKGFVVVDGDREAVALPVRLPSSSLSGEEEMTVWDRAPPAFSVPPRGDLPHDVLRLVKVEPVVVLRGDLLAMSRDAAKASHGKVSSALKLILGRLGLPLRASMFRYPLSQAHVDMAGLRIRRRVLAPGETQFAAFLRLISAQVAAGEAQILKDETQFDGVISFEPRQMVEQVRSLAGRVRAVAFDGTFGVCVYNVEVVLVVGVLDAGRTSLLMGMYLILHSIGEGVKTDAVRRIFLHQFNSFPEVYRRSMAVLTDGEAAHANGFAQAHVQWCLAALTRWLEERSSWWSLGAKMTKKKRAEAIAAELAARYEEQSHALRERIRMAGFECGETESSPVADGDRCARSVRERLLRLQQTDLGQASGPRHPSLREGCTLVDLASDSLFLRGCAGNVVGTASLSSCRQSVDAVRMLSRLPLMSGAWPKVAPPATVSRPLRRLAAVVAAARVAEALLEVGDVAPSDSHPVRVLLKEYGLVVYEWGGSRAHRSVWLLTLKDKGLLITVRLLIEELLRVLEFDSDADDLRPVLDTVLLACHFHARKNAGERLNRARRTARASLQSEADSPDGDKSRAQNASLVMGADGAAMRLREPVHRRSLRARRDAFDTAAERKGAGPWKTYREMVTTASFCEFVQRVRELDELLIGSGSVKARHFISTDLAPTHQLMLLGPFRLFPHAYVETTNLCESHNHKLKKRLSPSSTLCTFLVHLVGRVAGAVELPPDVAQQLWTNSFAARCIKTTADRIMGVECGRSLVLPKRKRAQASLLTAYLDDRARRESPPTAMELAMGAVRMPVRLPTATRVESAASLVPEPIRMVSVVLAFGTCSCRARSLSLCPHLVAASRFFASRSPPESSHFVSVLAPPLDRDRRDRHLSQAHVCALFPEAAPGAGTSSGPAAHELDTAAAWSAAVPEPPFASTLRNIDVADSRRLLGMESTAHGGVRGASFLAHQNRSRATAPRAAASADQVLSAAAEAAVAASMALVQSGRCRAVECVELAKRGLAAMVARLMGGDDPAPSGPSDDTCPAPSGAPVTSSPLIMPLDLREAFCLPPPTGPLSTSVSDRAGAGHGHPLEAVAVDNPLTVVVVPIVNSFNNCWFSCAIHVLRMIAQWARHDDRSVPGGRRGTGTTTPRSCPRRPIEKLLSRALCAPADARFRFTMAERSVVLSEFASLGDASSQPHVDFIECLQMIQDKHTSTLRHLTAVHTFTARPCCDECGSAQVPEATAIVSLEWSGGRFLPPLHTEACRECHMPAARTVVGLPPKLILASALYDPNEDRPSVKLPPGWTEHPGTPVEVNVVRDNHTQLRKETYLLVAMVSHTAFRAAGPWTAGEDARNPRWADASAARQARRPDQGHYVFFWRNGASWYCQNDTLTEIVPSGADVSSYKHFHPVLLVFALMGEALPAEPGRAQSQSPVDLTMSPPMPPAPLPASRESGSRPAPAPNPVRPVTRQSRLRSASSPVRRRPQPPTALISSSTTDSSAETRSPDIRRSGAESLRVPVAGNCSLPITAAAGRDDGRTCPWTRLTERATDALRREARQYLAHSPQSVVRAPSPLLLPSTRRAQWRPPQLRLDLSGHPPPPPPSAADAPTTGRIDYDAWRRSLFYELPALQRCPRRTTAPVPTARPGQGPEPQPTPTTIQAVAEHVRRARRQ